MASASPAAVPSPPAATGSAPRTVPVNSGPPLKSPRMAAFLAFLVPGLGHLYQGRTFKGILYAVCILGTFFFGLFRLGDGKVVYFDWSSPEKATWAYACQFWVGLPALPAMLQQDAGEGARGRGAGVTKPLMWLTSLASIRHENAFRSGVDGPVGGRFEGRFDSRSSGQGDVVGDLSLAPDGNGNITGTLTGTLTKNGAEPTPVSLRVTMGEVSRRVSPDPNRPVALLVEEDRPAGQPGQEGRIPVSGRLVGTIPRSVWDWYGAPLIDRELLSGDADTDLEQAHFTLGTRFELGVVYTMIAGLLNILAIYDALEGPAYGDEERELEEGKKLLGGKS